MRERELPVGWKRKKLGEIATCITKGATPTSYGYAFQKSGIKFVKIENIINNQISESSIKQFISPEAHENQKRSILESGDVLFSIAGTIGNACLVKKKDLPSNANQAIAIIKGTSRVFDPDFLLFFLRSKLAMDQLTKKVRGVALNNVSLGDVRDIIVTIPPLPIQHNIVAVLEQTEAVKRQRQEADALTGALLQSVFLEMFGDPVRNERGWEITIIGGISNRVSSGATPRGGSDVYDTSGIMFIRSQNVHMNRLVEEDIAYISDDIHQSMQRSQVRTGDILFNITGASIGRVAWFTGEDNSANVNQHVCIIRTDKNKILPEFLSYQLSLPSYQNKIMANQSGATRQAFNYSQIKNFDIIIPSLALQQQFAQIVESVEALREKQVSSGEEIDELFEGLMQRAFSGKLVEVEA